MRKIIVQFQKAVSGYNAGDIAGFPEDRALDLRERGWVTWLDAIVTSEAQRFTPVEDALRDDAPVFEDSQEPASQPTAEESAPAPVAEGMDDLPSNWEDLSWARRRAIAIRLGAPRTITGNSVDAYLRKQAAARGMR